MSRQKNRVRTIASVLGWGLMVILAALDPLEGSPARVEVPAAGTELVAGSVVRVSWHALPPEAKEMELYLSLDGGRSYPLRLTPQLPPGLDGLLWCVPNLPTPTARLRLRMGIPGGGEVDAEPSPVFRIVAAGAVSAEPVVLRGGEQWIGRGTDSAPRAPASLGDSGDEVSALLRLSLPGEAPRLPRYAPAASDDHPLAREHGPRHDGSARLPPRPGETAPLPLRR